MFLSIYSNSFIIRSGVSHSCQAIVSLCLLSWLPPLHKNNESKPERHCHDVIPMEIYQSISSTVTLSFESKAVVDYLHQVYLRHKEGSQNRLPGDR